MDECREKKMSEEESQLSRRTVLGRMGASVTVGGAGVLALPSPLQSYIRSETTTREFQPDTEPVPEDETPYAVWHYEPDDDGMERTAPINVVFPLETATFGDVTSTIRQAGLTGPPLEYIRYAWDRDREAYRRQQWTAAETALGLSGRMHVRCWKLADTASIQVHLDSAAIPEHEVISYARGRDAVERIFQEDGWTIDDESLHLGNDSWPDHDGWATVIRQ